MQEIEEILILGALELKLNLSSTQIMALIKYAKLLIKWNKVYNLTAVNSIKDIVQLHILDALTTINLLQNATNIIDVGSGMGSPGIIIAICLPMANIVLIDSSQKKIAFLQQVIIETKLKNAKAICSRVEDYSNKFDIIISRAFASVALFIKLTCHLLQRDGYFIAMKSQGFTAEIHGIVDRYNIETIEVFIPKLNVKRYLLKVKCDNSPS